MSHVDDQHRLVWRENRRRLERRLHEARLRSTPAGDRPFSPLLHGGLDLAVLLAARLTGLHRRGLRNALDVRLSRVEFRFPHLPRAFDGYTLLHLSDLHVGTVPGLEVVLADALAGARADFAVVTGDFQSLGRPSAAEVGRQLAPLIDAVAAPDGVAAVLGNHDEGALVEVLEGLGVRMLVNEALTLARGGERIHVVGTDDVHFFHTPAAEAALAGSRDGFRIALVHTVGLVDVAAHLGYALYLTGHTHGGQICLPSGRPVFTALDRHRHLAKGPWRHGGMQGFTSSGTGSGTPPLRFNSRPEVTLIRLVRE